MNNDKGHHDSEITVYLGTGKLSIEDVVGVARLGWHVAEIGQDTDDSAAKEAYDRVEASREWVKQAVEKNAALEARGEKGEAFYGINTGFGPKAGRKALGKEDIPWVSRNLIVSHSTGVGDALHPEIVRAAMLIRANSLAQGYSGVRPKLINTLVKMLNCGIIPVIPEYGSVGASGDLAPLSHLAQVLSVRPEGGDQLGDLPDDYDDESGQAYLDLDKLDGQEKFSEVITIDGKKYAVLSGHKAMEARGIKPLELRAKEGLAFNNGATFSAAIAALALYDAENIARHAEISAALSVEALLGFRDAFVPKLQEVRRHKGQMNVANRILTLVQGSTLVDGDVNVKPRVIPPQDAYSIRVTPQVTGAVWDTLKFLRQTITDEINAATDNPFIFLDETSTRKYRTFSGGNFHGAPLAYAMDFLSIVMTDLGNLSERRTFKLTDDNLSNGLPLMLIVDKKTKPARTSGMMIAQYLAAGLVSDCKTLAHPDSVDSIPTSANQEDHVSMSMNAARHARTVVKNIEFVIAIELLCAFIGLNWRINDLEEKIAQEEYKGDEKRPEDKDEENRNRVEEAVVYFRDPEKNENNLSPEPGKGNRIALDIIEQKLYPDGNALPRLGEEPTAEDRFLQPYVLRVTDLLKSKVLVDKLDSHIPDFWVEIEDKEKAKSVLTLSPLRV